MATITKPMALDESFNTTETTPRSQADVLAAIESAIRQGFGQSAADVSYDNTTSGLTADDVQEAIDELAAEKVDKVDGKGLSTNDYTDEDKEALDNMELDIASTQTVSGNPLTLTDAAPINAESLVVELEPKQDLHGQSSPYVGGAWKNKLPLDLATIKSLNNTDGTWSGNVFTHNNGVTFTILTDSDGNVTGIAINGTPSANPGYAAMYLVNGVTLPSGSYILNGGVSNNVYLDTSLSGSYVTSKGGDTALNVSGSSAYVRVIVEGNGSYSGTLYPMLRLSTETDPTFAPYSNICPITGYTECEVDDVGKNFLDTSTTTKSDITFTEDANGYITASPNNADGRNWGYSYCQYTDIELEAGTYNLDWWASTLSSSQYKAICVFDTSDNMLVYAENFGESGTSQFTVSKKTTVGVEAKILDSVVRIQIRENTAPQTYSPYSSTYATIQFGQTVYGGMSNFTEGGTDDEWNKDDTFSGWYKSSTETSVIIKEITDKKGGANQIYSNTYKYVSNQGFAVPEGAISDSTNSSYTTYVFVNDSRFAGKTVQECQAILESDGMYFVYQVETPTQLSTPPTDLKLLKGTNNLTTNGTTINLGYQPDNVIGEVKGEIEKCAVDTEFMQFTDGTDTFTDVNLSLDASLHTVSVVDSKIEQKHFICFEVMDKMGGVLQGILASCIAFTDGAKTPSGTAFRAYIESLQMYVNFRIYGSGGSYTLAYQSESSFSASAFYVRVRMMNNL